MDIVKKSMKSVLKDLRKKAVKKITNASFKFMERQFGYVVHCDKNIKKLRDGVEKLRAEIETVQRKVDRARDNAEEIETHVSKWLSNAGDLVKEAEQFLAAHADSLPSQEAGESSETVTNEPASEMETVQGRVDEERDNAEDMEPYVSNWLSKAGALLNEAKHFWTAHADKAWASGASVFKRRRLGEEAGGRLETVTNKLKKSGRFDSVGHRGPLTDIRLSQSNAGYQGFESRAEVFNDIMEAVENDNVYTIGIYGMTGVGVAREIATKAKDMNLFDKTVLVTISQNPDLRKVQGELADFLGLKLDKESLPGRASLLCTRFKREGEKILVILDDVCGKIYVEEAGIPLNGYNQGSKIVLTSRTQGVLIGEGVEVEREFQIGVLSESEV